MLQALKLNEQSSQSLLYCHALQKEVNELLEENNGELPWFENIMHEEAYIDAINEYIDAINDGCIKDDDYILMMSFDGAQLYANKASDCWIFIWIIFDYAPNGRYLKKSVLPREFISGPNRLKNTDSYLFTSLHHLLALQKEGLPLWNASQQNLVTSKPFFV